MADMLRKPVHDIHFNQRYTMKHTAHTHKTNAERILAQQQIAFEAFEYDVDHENLHVGIGVRVADVLGLNPDCCFKTLVLHNAHGDCFVCCIPSSCELDLKKVSAAAHEKSLSMLPPAQLEQACGYVRGGCSPIGMKKAYPVFIDESCMLFSEMYISGGRRGLTLKLAPQGLIDATSAQVIDIIHV